MKIHVSDHCVKQVINRKKKKNRKSAIFFAIGVFKIMIKTGQYKGNKCIKYNGYDDKQIIYDKESGYKFIYHNEKGTKFYTLVTFALRTCLDREIGKLMKILGIVK